ncbi:MAG: hypothetical protein M0C28_48335 [Candidatus Moduliflexus flocculans]|nr:hypothetical protein [Candidatus Moduliflexus flocculans]
MAPTDDRPAPTAASSSSSKGSTARARRPRPAASCGGSGDRGFKAAFFREPTRGKWGREIKRQAARADSLTPEQRARSLRQGPARERRAGTSGRPWPPARSSSSTATTSRPSPTRAPRGSTPGRIRRLNEAFAVPPDLVVVLDVDAGAGLARIRGRKTRDELFEREDYLVQVRDIFRSFKGRRSSTSTAAPIHGRFRAIWQRIESLLAHWAW